MVYSFSLTSSRPAASGPGVGVSTRAMRSARYLDRWSTVALAVVFTYLKRDYIDLPGPDVSIYVSART